MKNLILLFVFLTLFNLPAPAQIRASLIVASCAPEKGICETNQLYRYNFDNGQYTGRELIISSNAEDVNFGSGSNYIYQNRYALTGWADIIDIEKKKILHVSMGKLFRTEGSKIYLEVNNAGVPRGLYVYDLSTEKYELVRKTHDSMFFGELSPNGLRSANVSCLVNKGCGLQTVETDGTRKFFKGDFKAQVTSNPNRSEFLKTPVIWIDDELVLTQKNNGELVTVDLRGKVTPLVKIKIDKLPDSNPKLFRDNLGNIIYRCGDGDDYIIDAGSKTYRVKEFGEAFGFGHAELENDLKAFHEKRGETGDFNLGYGVYTNDYWAMMYTGKDENLGYPKGVKVYSKWNKSWTTIDIRWGAKFVGWITE